MTRTSARRIAGRNRSRRYAAGRRWSSSPRRSPISTTQIVIFVSVFVAVLGLYLVCFSRSSDLTTSAATAPEITCESHSTQVEAEEPRLEAPPAPEPVPVAAPDQLKTVIGESRALFQKAYRAVVQEMPNAAIIIDQAVSKANEMQSAFQEYSTTVEHRAADGTSKRGYEWVGPMGTEVATIRLDIMKLKGF